MPLTEERVREIANLPVITVSVPDYFKPGNEAVTGGPRVLPLESKQLAADWLALRAQNAALRQLADELIRRGCRNPECDVEECVSFRARLAALGEP